tara:strand:- start:417 stop:1184 length:768 start_codon:yes stop_codon:yes gene_type:complete
LKKNKLKYKLKNNIQTYGSWITISSPIIPEIMSIAKFDWLCVDLEHSSIDLNDLLSIIISIENNNIAPIVRVGENNPNLIKRVMDIGAYGVIVPNIKSREEALKAVESVKYPPAGNRGVGLFKAQKFGSEFEKYTRWLKNESVVILQIEHIDAVKKIDEIFSVKGIDAYMIGPYDLSGSINKTGKLNDPMMKSLINKIIKAGKKYSITAGIHSVSPDPKDAIKFKKNGFKFLSISLDSIFLSNKAKSTLDEIKKK